MAGKNRDCKETRGALQHALILNQILDKDCEAEIELQTVFMLVCKEHQDLTLLYLDFPQFHCHGLHSSEPPDFHHFSHQIPAPVWVWWTGPGLGISRVSWEPSSGQASLHCPGEGEESRKGWYPYKIQSLFLLSPKETWCLYSKTKHDFRIMES